MRGILRAVGAMLRALATATKTVAVYCWRTCKWVTKTVYAVTTGTVVAAAELTGAVVRAVLPSGRGRPSVRVPQVTAQTASAEPKPTADDAGMDRVKKLAVGLAAGHAPADLFEGMPDPVVEWLTAMDRKMLCKVGCAPDAQLVAHLRGKETMKGVLVYDEKAVAEYRRAQGLDLDPDMELDIEPKPALAA